MREIEHKRKQTSPISIKSTSESSHIPQHFFCYRKYVVKISQAERMSGNECKRNANAPLDLRPGLQPTLRRSCPVCQFATWWRKGPREVYDEESGLCNQTHLGLNPGWAILNTVIWGRVFSSLYFFFFLEWLGNNKVVIIKWSEIWKYSFSDTSKCWFKSNSSTYSWGQVCIGRT